VGHPFNPWERQKRPVDRQEKEAIMSMPTSATFNTAETSSGLFAEAVGGIATIVLAVLGLSGVSPEYLLAIATIVFGAALVIEGTSMVADYAHVLSASTAPFQVSSGGVSGVFLAGISGIILGVLALLGVAATALTSAAIIVFGSALLLSSSVSVNLHAIKNRPIGDVQTVDTASDAGMKVLVGVAAIVLGILAAAGTVTTKLDLIALIVLGGGILVTGNGLNNAMNSIINVANHGARAH
jgi:hypothetical protein